MNKFLDSEKYKFTSFTRSKICVTDNITVPSPYTIFTMSSLGWIILRFYHHHHLGTSYEMRSNFFQFDKKNAVYHSVYGLWLCPKQLTATFSLRPWHIHSIYTQSKPEASLRSAFFNQMCIIQRIFHLNILWIFFRQIVQPSPVLFRLRSNIKYMMPSRRTWKSMVNENLWFGRMLKLIIWL